MLSESESEDDKTVILADTKKKKQAPTQLAEQVDSMAKGSTQPKPATNQQDSTTAELFSTNSSLGDNNLQIAVQSDENQQMNAEKACSNNTLEIPEQILVPSNEKELIASTDYSRRDAVTKTENAGDLHIATLGTQQVILHVSAKLFNKFRKKNAAGLSVEFIADNISEIAQKFLNDGISQAVIFLSSNNSIILDFDDIIKFSTVKTPALEQESDKNEQATTQLTEHITQEGFIQVLQPKSSVNIRDNNVQLVNESDQPIQGDNGIALMDQSEDDEHFYGALESQDTNSEGAKVNSTKGSGKYSSSSEQTLEIFNRYHSNITASTDDRSDEEFMATTANIGDESNQPTLNTASEGDFTLESNSSLQDTQPKTLAITLPVNDTQDNTDHPTSDSEKNDTTSQNTKRSKRTGIAVSTLAITGVISGIAIAVYSGMLAVGIAVGICFLIAAAVIYRCNNPSNLLKDSNAEVAMNQGQEL